MDSWVEKRKSRERESWSGGQKMIRTAFSSPFTPAQWQELHQQAFIYKHIISHASVPNHLILHPPNFLGGGGGGLQFTKGTDPEPGRCRRTDGKKWRCGRDVASPDHKYCERHTHRGRPRSRKLVEQQLTTTNTTKIPIPLCLPPPLAHSKLPYQSMKIIGCTDMMKDIGWSHHPWKLLSCSTSTNTMRSDASAVLEHYGDHELNLNYEHCRHLGEVADHRESPRSFIDAWSSKTTTTTTTTDAHPPCSVSNNLKLLPISTLSLSMNSGIEEECTDEIEMTLGLGDYKSQSQQLGWMSHVSTVGGPLGEVLQLTNPFTAV